MFLRALQSILSSDDFKVPSPANEDAVKTATSLLRWYEEHKGCDILESFVRGLYIQLNSCFTKEFSSLKLRREKMWESYHKLRTSQVFRSDWIQFVAQAIQQSAQPAFYQYITHYVFKILIEKEFSPNKDVQDTSEHPDCPLTKIEENALRYVAGYICRNVKEKIEASSLSHKDEMMDCLFHMAGDEEDESAGTEEWLNSIDRGGLWHMNDMTYSLFIIFIILMQRGGIIL